MGKSKKTSCPGLQPWPPRLLAVTMIMLFCCVPGCATSRAPEPLARTIEQDTPASRMSFWHRMTDQPVACNDDAFHGLLLYADKSDPSASYADRVEKLKARGWLSKSFDRPADEAVTRGTLAVAIVKILKLRGGWVLLLTGPTPRYAVRELVYRGVYPQSSPQQTFSGLEFIGIIGRVEDFRRGEMDDMIVEAP
jgi:hypothetical protein